MNHFTEKEIELFTLALAEKALALLSDQLATLPPHQENFRRDRLFNGLYRMVESLFDSHDFDIDKAEDETDTYRTRDESFKAECNDLAREIGRFVDSIKPVMEKVYGIGIKSRLDLSSIRK